MSAKRVNVNKRAVKKGNDIIPIVFSANAKYAPYIAVTITSIMKNASKDREYRFYVLYTELPATTILRLEDICGENYKTECVNVQEFCKDGMYSSAYFSIEMYYRIMIPEIFKQYDKVLYLDCDIVAVHDVSELYDVDLGDNLIGAVRNLMHDKMKKYIILSLGLDTDKYINSGVILFNCDQCRKEHYTDESFKLLAKRQDFRYPDQDLINMMSVDRIYYLDPRWNFTWHYRHLQESKNLELHLNDEDMANFYEYEKNPYLIHYTGEVKPWSNVNKYLSDYFWKYAAESNFYNLFLNRLINVNKESSSNKRYDDSINALNKCLVDAQARIDAMEKRINTLSANNTSFSNEIIENYEQDKYLCKYNDVIGSKSYKLGRMITFPIRKPVDFIVSVKRSGFGATIKRFPGKMNLYKNILLGRA
ncbi:glycosyltransferase family 8 protein [Pseudobutyrivibrio xylanivorans]|uniref:Glycosyl transferase family 8 n=1 Tax=Pseudobutyrivibrio xylanivorans TaxID=185007 RepID=A0A5P6VMW0_PSEXY|nr:glycosyltransferase family 8 protein [Pseudobutyrivibrio xylanivorans]QFJ53760.1 glycosyl transferase family 8 [Pseudobutyrivibrio xylanivorans]